MPLGEEREKPGRRGRRGRGPPTERRQATEDVRPDLQRQKPGQCWLAAYAGVVVFQRLLRAGEGKIVRRLSKIADAVEGLADDVQSS